MENRIVCETCGSSDIEELQWRKVNTGEFSGLGNNETEDRWCCNCQENTDFITEEEFKKQKKY